MSKVNYLRRRTRVSYFESRHVREARKDTLRKMQANQCCWCGKQMQSEKVDKWDYETIEHLTPVSKGGRNNMENLALAHKKCNEERGTKDREPLLRRVADRMVPPA
jgi:5-methylcytosine-specific restriction endonuclease McrA